MTVTGFTSPRQRAVISPRIDSLEHSSDPGAIPMLPIQADQNDNSMKQSLLPHSAINSEYSKTASFAQTQEGVPLIHSVSTTVHTDFSTANDSIATSKQFFASETQLSPSSSLSASSAAQPIQVDKYGRQVLMGVASTAACTATLTNNILGAGMLGLPQAFSVSGFLLGFVLLCFSACSSALGLHLLSVCARTVSTMPSSFYAVARAAVPRSTAVIDLAVAIKCFGAATSYLIVIGDLMPDAVSSLLNLPTGHVMTDRRFWIAVFMFTIVIPLACLRSLNALRFTSTFGILFVWFLVIVVSAYALLPTLNEPLVKGETAAVILNYNIMKKFSIFIFGFTCHQNIFNIHNELKNNTQRRVNTVIASSIGVALTVYILIATMGYSTWGDNVKPNLLNNYPSNLVLTIARFLIALNVAFTFPLQCNPCRTSVSLLMHQYKYRNMINTSLIPKHSPEPSELTLITACICCCSFIIAMMVSDLGKILSIVGATGSTMISYILPGLCYFCLHPDFHVKRVLAIALFCWGCIIMPLCLIFIII